MHGKKYFIGKISDCVQERGWFFGHFMKEDLLCSDLVEVAYQDVSNKKPEPGEWHYHKKSLEINIVLEGGASFRVNGKQVTVKKNDFWVVYPGTTIEGFSSTKDIKLIIIRAPSIPNDKYTK